MSTDPSDPNYIAFVARDIESAGADFVQQAQIYNGLMHYDDTQCPFGTPRAGTDRIDRMLDTVLRLAGEVHVELKQAMENHGVKLQDAAANYDTVEKATIAHVQSVGQLCTYAEEQPLPVASADDN